MSKNISCVIPAHNEEKTIASVLKTAKAAKQKGLISEIIVVSDGSNDKTAEIAQSAKIDRVIILKKNIGKGGAVIKGIGASKSENILMLDADLVNLSVKHIKKIVEPLKNSEADMVIAFMADDNWQVMMPQLSGQRAFRKKAFQDIINNKKFQKSGYSFEMMLNRYAGKKNLKTLYIPVTHLGHIKRAVKYGTLKNLMTQASFYSKMANFYKLTLLLLAIIILLLLGYLIFVSPNRGPNDASAIFSSPKLGDKILIVSAHPDDETLGAGGYIKEAIKKGAEVKVIIITNGDANKLSTMAKDKTFLPKNQDFIEEGNRRMAESRSALLILGLKEDDIFFLGFPDGGIKDLLTKNWQESRVSSYTKWNKNNYDGTYQKDASYTGTELISLLDEIISQEKPQILITHSSFDRNTDHQAILNFVKTASGELTNREIISKPKIYSFLIHYNIYQYPHPRRLETKAGLTPPEDLKDSCRWSSFPLSSEDEADKLAAIKKYKSQLLGNYFGLLFAFVRTNELFCSID